MTKKIAMTGNYNFNYKTEENCLYELMSFFKYKSIEAEHKILFYKTFFVINSDIIHYSKVFEVSKNKDGLRILIVDKEITDIPCQQDIKREVFNYFKCLNKNAEQVNINSILGTTILYLGGHYFLVHLRSSSYEDLRRIILKRIAFHFFPKQSNQIIIEHFDEFKFFIKEKSFTIPLENSSDLGSALFHFNNRLMIYIKHIKE